MPRLSPFRPLLRLAAPPSAPVVSTSCTPALVRSSPILTSTLACSTSLSPLLRTQSSTSASTLLSATRSSILSSLPSLSAPAGAGAFGQVRTVTYGSEYQPSQRIRKRRHGFLARNKTRNGRKTLMRRRFRGKAKLSH